MDVRRVRRRYLSLRRNVERLELDMSMHGVAFTDLQGVFHFGVRMKTKTGRLEREYVKVLQRFRRFRREHPAEIVVLEAGGLERPKFRKS